MGFELPVLLWVLALVVVLVGGALASVLALIAYIVSDASLSD